MIFLNIQHATQPRRVPEGGLIMSDKIPISFPIVRRIIRNKSGGQLVARCDCCGRLWRTQREQRSSSFASRTRHFGAVEVEPNFVHPILPPKLCRLHTEEDFYTSLSPQSQSLFVNIFFPHNETSRKPSR